MKNFKIYFFLFSTFVLISCTWHFPTTEYPLSAHYQLRTVFEKDLSTQSDWYYINLFGNEYQNFNIDVNPFAPSVTQWYHVPRILYVDNHENIYLSIPGRIEIFDINGNSVFKFRIPDDSLQLNYYSWNEHDFYMFFKKHYYDSTSEAYKISLPPGEVKKLETGDLESLSPDILPPYLKEDMAQQQRYISSITDSNGIHYGLAWGMLDGMLFRKDNARYVDPTIIRVLKFDSSFKQSYHDIIPEDGLYPETYNKYIYDSISIEKLYNEKIVCIGTGNCYVDKKGNIYLDGVKSNYAKRVWDRRGRIKVEKPIFFLVKLENK